MPRPCRAHAMRRVSPLPLYLHIVHTYLGRYRVAHPPTHTHTHIPSFHSFWRESRAPPPPPSRDMHAGPVVASDDPPRGGRIHGGTYVRTDRHPSFCGTGTVPWTETGGGLQGRVLKHAMRCEVVILGERGATRRWRSCVSINHSSSSSLARLDH